MVFPRLLPDVLSGATSGLSTDLGLGRLRDFFLRRRSVSNVDASRALDRLGRCESDVAVSFARHPFGVLASDGRLDRIVVVLGGLFSRFALDRKKSSPSIPVPLSPGMRDRLDKRRVVSLLHHHWIYPLLACPFANPLALRSADRQSLRHLRRGLHDDAQHGLVG